MKVAIHGSHYVSMFLLFILPMSGAWSQTERKEILVKHTQDFEPTGDGSNAHWKTSEWIILAKRRGNSNYQTRAKLLYSDTGIYVVFDCSDEKITATMKDDFADLWKEDVVEVFFWTDESAPLYFEYELSPLNHELAILVPNFSGDFFGWKPWHYTDERQTKHTTKVVKDERGKVRGWIAEFFIPYALLKPLKNVPPKSGATWRTNFYRIDYDEPSSSWSWQPVQSNFHDYERFGVMRFE